MLKSIMRSLGLVSMTDHMIIIDRLTAISGDRDFHRTRATQLETVTKEKQVAYNDAMNIADAEMSAHNATKELLRVCELRNTGLAEERDGLDNALVAANNRLIKLAAGVDAMICLKDVSVLPNLGPDGGRISRYALLFTFVKGGKEQQVTTRSLTANNKNKRELEEDVTAIKAQVGF